MVGHTCWSIGSYVGQAVETILICLRRQVREILEVKVLHVQELHFAVTQPWKRSEVLFQR